MNGFKEIESQIKLLKLQALTLLPTGSKIFDITFTFSLNALPEFDVKAIVKGKRYQAHGSTIAEVIKYISEDIDGGAFDE